MVDYLSVIVENLTGFDPLKDTRKRGTWRPVCFSPTPC